MSPPDFLYQQRGPDVSGQLGWRLGGVCEFQSSILEQLHPFAMGEEADPDASGIGPHSLCKGREQSGRCESEDCCARESVDESVIFVFEHGYSMSVHSSQGCQHVLPCIGVITCFDKVVQDPIEENDVGLLGAYCVPEDEFFTPMAFILGEQHFRGIKNRTFGSWVRGQDPICKDSVASADVDEGKLPIREVSVDEGLDHAPTSVIDVLAVKSLKLGIGKLTGLHAASIPINPLNNRT